MREPEKKYLPATATVEVPGPFKVESETLRFGLQLHVASQPAGNDAIKLVWEINSFQPPGRRYETPSGVFTGTTDDLTGKTFRIMASRDGKLFEEVGEVAGPANSFVHRGVTPNRVHYYKVAAFDMDETEWAESPLTLGATGANLMTYSDFEALPLGSLPDPLPGAAYSSHMEMLSIEEGARPWSSGRHVMKVDTSRGKASITNFYDDVIQISAGKAYLHGWWVRSPGQRPVYLGREYRDVDTDRAFYVQGIGLSNNPNWTFVVQLVTCDPESLMSDSGSPASTRKWPQVASQLRSWLVIYGHVELDDLWIVEVEPPDGGAE